MPFLRLGVWVYMNDTQAKLYRFVADHPGCTHGELWQYARVAHRGRCSWLDHLYTLTSGFPYGNFIVVPRMIAKHQGCYFPILGPFISDWRREKDQQARLERLSAELDQLHRLVALSL